MNPFLKLLNSKVFLVIMVLALAGVAIYQKYSFKTPQQVGENFLKNLTKEEVEDSLSKEDAKVYKSHKEDFLKYLPLNLVQVPVTTVVFKEIVESSDKNKQVFYEVDGRKITLTLIDQGSWKVSLDLDKHQKLQAAEKALEEASISGDENLILEAYNALNLIDPREEYEEQIKVLAAKINEKQAMEDYVQKVKIAKVGIKKGLISAFIQNTGSKNLNKVSAEILITNKEGKILFKETQVIFEKIDGSKLYGSSIPAGFERKISFDVSSLSKHKELLVLISPVSISYE